MKTQPTNLLNDIKTKDKHLKSGNFKCLDVCYKITSNSLEVAEDAIINGVTIGTGGGDVYTDTVLGTYALRANTTGESNTAIGYQALFSNTTGSSNTASGATTLNFNTTGNHNTASGHGALYSNTTGSFNTASGVDGIKFKHNGQGQYGQRG